MLWPFGRRGWGLWRVVAARFWGQAGFAAAQARTSGSSKLAASSTIWLGHAGLVTAARATERSLCRARKATASGGVDVLAATFSST